MSSCALSPDRTISPGGHPVSAHHFLAGDGVWNWDRAASEDTGIRSDGPPEPGPVFPAAQRLLPCGGQLQQGALRECWGSKAEVFPSCGPFYCVLSQVLELDENNEKAFYRRGEARLYRNEFGLAKEDFQKVLQVNPANQAARAQILICQNKIKEHHEQDKKIYANMFQKFAEQDAKVCKLSVLG